MAFVRYYVGDVVKMKKSHPCGSDEWEVKRIGTDFLIEWLRSSTLDAAP